MDVIIDCVSDSRYYIIYMDGKKSCKSSKENKWLEVIHYFKPKMVIVGKDNGQKEKEQKR